MPRQGQLKGLVMALLGQLTVPAHVEATPQAYTDGLEAALSMDANGNLRVVVLNTAAAPVNIIDQHGIADSLTAAGQATAPAANAAIVTLAVTAGVWDVAVMAALPLGNPVAADVANMIFKNNGVAVGNGLFCDGGTTWLKRVTVAGAQNFTVNAIAAGTAGVVYLASITATRIS